eukprot:5929949-Prymnesium_polylepis.1
MFAQRQPLSRSPAPAMPGSSHSPQSRVAVDRSSARKVFKKAARRSGLDRGVDFERYELNAWV